MVWAVRRRILSSTRGQSRGSRGIEAGGSGQSMWHELGGVGRVQLDEIGTGLGDGFLDEHLVLNWSWSRIDHL